MLPSSRMMRLDSSLKIMEFSGFSQIFQNRIRLWAFPQFSTTSAPHLSRLHLVRFLEFWGRLQVQALLSQQLTQYSAPVSRRWVVLGCLLGYLVPLSARSAPVSWCWKTHSQRCPSAAAVAAAAIAKHLLITIFGDGRGVESLSNKFHSPFWEITLKAESAGTELYTITALDLVCQNRNPLSCTRAKLTQ